MTKNQTLSAIPLKALLDRVFLSGTMTECLIDVQGGSGHILALDPTNSVLVDANENLPGLADAKYGIGKLDTLVKFLGMCGEEELTYTIDDKWLTLRRKGHGKFSILLLENDMVATQCESDPEISKNMGEYPHQLALVQEFIDDAKSYIGLISGSLVSFHIKSNGRVTLSNNTTNEVERFEIPFGALGAGIEEFTVAVYSLQLTRILDVLTVGQESVVYLAKDRPVIIQQDHTNVWALTNSAL
jgi:hypothetical protein